MKRSIRVATFLSVLLVAGTIGVAAFAGSDNPGRAALARLEAAASKGDALAAEILDRFSEYAASRGLSPEALAAGGREVAQIEQTSQLMVAARGLVPFSVRIDVDVRLSDRRSLDAYVSDRRSALVTLATLQSGRALTVAVGFERRPALTTFLELSRRYGAVLEQVLVDATVRGERRFTQVMDGRAADQLQGMASSDIVAWLQQSVRDSEQPLCGASPGDIEWLVQSARVNISSDKAVALSVEQGILLVDPLDDVLDPYRSQALFVTAGAWPNVTTALESIEDRRPPDNTCQEAK